MSKVRMDFVTNSSSSCFVIQRGNNKEHTVESVRCVMETLIKTHNEITGANINLDDICTITDSKDREYINQLFSEQCWGGEEGANCRLSYEDRRKLGYPKCNKCPKRTDKCKSYTDIVLDGQAVIFGNENEVPYILHDAIEDYLGATRYHLG